MARLHIDSLNKSYGAARVLIDINLAIENGEFVVLVGPSGCGKSTLLRMIAGLDAATSGDIFIAERLVNALAPAERKIAMVFQSYALYPHMDVRKNMTFGLKFTGVAPAERDRRVAEAARMLRLEELLSRHPRDLSGGQRQRVAIGRAIVREPDVFLFDEPLSNLDAALRVSTRVEIARLHRLLGATMIYVTHDQIEAMTLADRIVVMNQGRIEQVGKPLELYYAPANLFVAGFIGSPAMNFFPAAVERLEAGRAVLKGAAISPFSLPAGALRPGGPLTVGVRPEHLAAVAQGDFSVTGTVELVERLGEASFAHVRRADDKLMVVEIRGRDTPAPGNTLSFAAPAQDLHIFDEAGRRLDLASPAERIGGI
jgi:ABC-type sugar transport system ATPase subunit